MRHEAEVTRRLVKHPNDVICDAILIRADKITGDVHDVVVVVTDSETFDVMT